MEIAFQAFGYVFVWVRMRVREVVSERKHPRNKMCGIRILNAFVALHGLLLEGAFSSTWAQVKVRVRSFFLDMHFGEKKNGWKSKREKVNVERGTYSHRRAFNTTAFSIPNLAFISHFSNVILYFAASHTQKVERKREHTCLFPFFFLKNASLTQFLPILLFSTIFHIIDAFVSMYWAVKLENRKCIKCKIAENVHCTLLARSPHSAMPFFCQ